MSATRNNWFFEKVNGKQFHAKFSGCDNFSVRLQVRKKKGFSWSKVAYRLSVMDWLACFKVKEICTKDDTRMIISCREKSRGNHRKCVLRSKNYIKAAKKARMTGNKAVKFDWPEVCLLRRKKNV